MTTDTKTHALPAVLKHEDCESLFAFLHDARGQPVVLDCAAVTKASGLGLQMIAAAAKSWGAQECDFDVANSSDAFCDASSLLGLDQVLFSLGDDA